MSWIDIDEEPNEPVSMRALDFVHIGLGFIRDVLGAAAEAVDEAQSVLGGHLNHLRERDDFAATAGLEIETLINPNQEEA